MIRSSLLLLCLFVSLSSNVFAEELSLENSFYGTLNVGMAQPLGSYSEKNYNDDDIDFDDGVLLSTAIGYEWTKKYRLEGELTYRKMDFSHATSVSTGTAQNGSGDQAQYSLMLNAIIQPLPEMIISPFFGAGVGYTKVSWNDVTVNGTVFLDDTDTVFTYQLIVGGAYAFNQALALELSYRYVAMEDIEITNSNGLVGKVTDQNQNNFLVGLRYRF